MRSILALNCALVLLAGCGDDAASQRDGGVVDAGEPDASLCAQPPTGRVSLPADDGRHGDPVEWWYWTGHLQAQDGRWFGFEETFFRGTRYGIDGQMAHFAITDVSDASFHHRSLEQLGAPATVSDGFDLALGELTATGGDGHDTLHGTVDGYVLDLQLEASKAPVLQHGDGYTDYSFGGNTYYYSRERMAPTGTLVVNGETLTVTGAAWFDHQYGDIQSAVDHGWDWFALQLDDGREIMLYVVRVNGTPQLVGGSYTDAACSTSEIASDAFEITPLGTWTSPRDGCSYPSGWTVKVRDLSLTVTPVLADQELYSTTPRYWEGAATVTGDATGRAYVELTGYCK